MSWNESKHGAALCASCLHLSCCTTMPTRPLMWHQEIQLGSKTALFWSLLRLNVCLPSSFNQQHLWRTLEQVTYILDSAAFHFMPCTEVLQPWQDRHGTLWNQNFGIPPDSQAPLTHGRVQVHGRTFHHCHFLASPLAGPGHKEKVAMVGHKENRYYLVLLRLLPSPLG